jgi:predicted amidohydrolase YtcJ
MLFQSLINSNVDVHAHCNGDGAADNMIAALEWARNNSNATNDARIVMIHAQTVREDQLDKFNRLGLIPSFFSDHIYYWGDKHYQIFLGPNRANRMNPAGSALKRGLKFTLHNDSPTVLAGLFNGVNTFLKLISAAVTRTTANGRVLDDGTQKIPVY